MKKRASKRIDIDTDFRLDLESQKQGNGVHLNYLGIATSTLERHPHVDIKPRTALNWLRKWCEWDIPIPKHYSPQCEHERGSRKTPIVKSPNAVPVFALPTSDTNDTKPKENPFFIRVGIDDNYSVIISNGVQELKISSSNGNLSISRP